MRTWFVKLVGLGVDEAQSEFDAQRIRMLNTGVLAAFALVILTIPLAMMAGGAKALPGSILLLSTAAFVFWLQSRGRHYGAALTLTVVGLLVVTGQFLHLGPKHGTHYWLLGLIMFPYLFFPRASRVTPNLLGAAAMLLFGCMAIVDSASHGLEAGHTISQALAALLILSLSMSLRQLLLRVEDKTETQKARIEAAQRVIEKYPEQNPNPVLRVGAKGDIRYANPAAEPLLLQLDLELGALFPIALPAAPAKTSESHLVEMAIGARVYEFKISSVASMGFYILYGTDITAMKEHELSRRAVTEALEQERRVSRLKDEFLASLSHELRTPLNAILGLSEALQEEVYGPLTAKQLESLATIWGAGHRQLSMVDDLLDFARLGARRFPTHIASVDLASCVQMVGERYQPKAEKAGLSLTLNLGEGDRLARVDSRHLQRIISKLLDNAIKFTPEGGSVGVDLEEDMDSSALKIIVWDTGIGISDEQRQDLFRPFVQLAGGLSRRFGGTGLGLALTSRLAELLAVSLNVTSTVGAGSRFTISVPRDVRHRFRLRIDLQDSCSFVLSEWLHAMNVAHLADWVSVPGREGALAARGPGSGADMRMLAPEHTPATIAQLPSTHRVLCALELIRQEEAWRLPEAWRAVLRAIWKEGVDVSSWEGVQAALVDFALPPLDDTSLTTARVPSEGSLEEKTPALTVIRTGETIGSSATKAEVATLVDTELDTLSGPLRTPREKA